MNPIALIPNLAGSLRSAVPTRSGLLLAALTCLASLPCTMASAQAPSLGLAATFAVLGGSTVTSTGPSAITGNVGVSPGTSVTGFPPATVVGAIYAGGPIAAIAQADTTLAYNAILGEVCTTNLSGPNLGGLTLGPGVYCLSSTAQITGMLTLQALGNSNATFIFKVGTTLTTSPGASVNLVNGADACRVFWQVGDSATLGASTSFAGTILAQNDVTVNTGASISGRVLARTGTVTLDGNSVVSPSAAAWDNYGIGWPGSQGIPSLTLSALPVVGTTPNMLVQNVSGSPTYGLLLWGTGPVSLPTALGGNLLVQAVHWWSTPIGPGQHAMPMAIPADVALICVDFYVQVLEFDPAASHFVAFTPGLHMVFGV